MHDGRGRISIRGGAFTATRVAWKIAKGEEPQGYVCHSCDNPSCVNPSHLWIGTARDNALDRSAKRRTFNVRKTHCPKGHEYTPENTYLTSSNRRSCKECARIWNRQHRQRGRAEKMEAV
jgi:hypothetical protein